MAKKITIQGFEFTRNDQQDFSILVEDQYGNSLIIEDITKFEEGLSIKSNEGIDLNELDEVLNTNNVNKIIRELNLEVNQAYQQY